MSAVLCFVPPRSLLPSVKEVGLPINLPCRNPSGEAAAGSRIHCPVVALTVYGIPADKHPVPVVAEWVSEDQTGTVFPVAVKVPAYAPARGFDGRNRQTVVHIGYTWMSPSFPGLIQSRCCKTGDSGSTHGFFQLYDARFAKIWTKGL